jgi:hypothetical protein
VWAGLSTRVERASRLRSSAGMESDLVLPDTADAAGSGPDLDHLLQTGPFPAALQAAVRASDLGRDRILDRLLRGGTPISAATLSYWQSGRSRPERPASLAALAGLEVVLGVGEGALSRLLEPPRPRGRHTPVEQTAMGVVMPYGDAMQRTLDEVDMKWGSSLNWISQHDRVEIGVDGGQCGLWIRAVLCATQDGPDRCVYFHHVDEPGIPLPEVRPLRGCRLGAVHAEPEVGLKTVELLFPHALSRGEALLIEWFVSYTPPYPQDGNYDRTFRLPLREYVLEVQFTAPALPVRCVQYWAPETGEPSAEGERPLGLDEDGRAILVALDLAPGRRGMRWELG